jgi:hypothetical protein
MPRTILALFVAVGLAACGHITIGPVDTSCHVSCGGGR